MYGLSLLKNRCQVSKSTTEYFNGSLPNKYSLQKFISRKVMYFIRDELWNRIQGIRHKASGIGGRWKTKQRLKHFGWQLGINDGLMAFPNHPAQIPIRNYIGNWKAIVILSFIAIRSIRNSQSQCRLITNWQLSAPTAHLYTY